MKRLLILAILLTTLPAWATIKSPGDGNQATVANCIAGTGPAGGNCNTAAVQGDTIVIPPGNWTWTTPVAPTVGLTFMGAGIGFTTVTGNASALFNVQIASGCPAFPTPCTRIVAMTLTGTGSANNLIQFDGAGMAGAFFRVDHVFFKATPIRPFFIGFNNTALLSSTPIYGLIDHVSFTSDAACEGGGGFGVYYGGQLNTWGAADDLGSANAIYVEQSVFDFSPGNQTPGCLIMDTEQGGKVVYRDLINANGEIQWHDFQNGLSMGARRNEEYRINFTCIAGIFNCGFTPMQIRGGSVVGFDINFPQCTTCTSAPAGYQSSISTEVWRAETNGTYGPGIVSPVDFPAAASTLSIPANVCSRSGSTITCTVGNTLAAQQVVSITGMADSTFNCSPCTITSATPTGGAGPPTQFVYSAGSGTATSGGGTVSLNEQLIASDLHPHCDGGTNPACGVNENAGQACQAATCGGGSCGTCQNFMIGTVGTQGNSGAGNTILGFVDGTSTAGGYPALMQSCYGQYVSTNSPRNKLSPCLFDNIIETNAGTQLTSINVSAIDASYIQINRDYYITNTGCSPNGCGTITTGVGRGTLAQRPTTCTQGTIYRDIKSGIWYQCGASNGWTVIYTPLGPHPMADKIPARVSVATN